MAELNLRVYQGPGLSQQLNLAPQLINWLKLLQAPTLELAAMVQQELDSNPALEVAEVPSAPEDEIDSGSAVVDDLGEERLKELAELNSEWADDYAQQIRLKKSAVSDDQDLYERVMQGITAHLSLAEHLQSQLVLAEIDAEGKAIGELIVGSLDPYGYLVTPLAELAEVGKTTVAAVEKVLQIIQKMDPPGVAARSLAECLALQIPASAGRDFLPRRIISGGYLQSLANGVNSELAAKLQVTPAELAEAFAYIRSLDPEPGRLFANEQPNYITPDVTVLRLGDEYVVELNDEQIPRLRISNSCRQLLEGGKLTPGDLAYLRRKIRGATFIIQGITQRQQTLKRIAQEVVRLQQDFFDRNDGELVPLTMNKVAHIIGVHETTVSRAVANKYMQTPRGIFEMKQFFKTGYLCADGSALTPDQVKSTIFGILKSEKRPMTDLQISERLKESGVNVARRTVAKYREELGINSSKDRRLKRLTL